MEPLSQERNDGVDYNFFRAKRAAMSLLMMAVEIGDRASSVYFSYYLLSTTLPTTSSDANAQFAVFVLAMLSITCLVCTLWLGVRMAGISALVDGREDDDILTVTLPVLFGCVVVPELLLLEMMPTREEYEGNEAKAAAPFGSAKAHTSFINARVITTAVHNIVHIVLAVVALVVVVVGVDADAWWVFVMKLAFAAGTPCLGFAKMALYDFPSYRRRLFAVIVSTVARFFVIDFFCAVVVGFEILFMLGAWIVFIPMNTTTLSQYPHLKANIFAGEQRITKFRNYTDITLECPRSAFLSNASLFAPLSLYTYNNNINIINNNNNETFACEAFLLRRGVERAISSRTRMLPFIFPSPSPPVPSPLLLAADVVILAKGDDWRQSHYNKQLYEKKRPKGPRRSGNLTVVTISVDAAAGVAVSSLSFYFIKHRDVSSFLADPLRFRALRLNVVDNTNATVATTSSFLRGFYSLFLLPSSSSSSSSFVGNITGAVTVVDSPTFVLPGKEEGNIIAHHRLQAGEKIVLHKYNYFVDRHAYRTHVVWGINAAAPANGDKEGHYPFVRRKTGDYFIAVVVCASFSVLISFFTVMYIRDETRWHDYFDNDINAILDNDLLV